MTVQTIVHKQAGYVVSGLKRLTKKEAHWIKREALSKLVYLLGCEVLALFAIAYHSCMLALKSVPATALALASLVPISRLREMLKNAPKGLCWDYLGECHLMPLLAAAGVAVMAPGLTLFAQHAESMRRVIQLTMPMPSSKWHEKLGWSEDKADEIVFFVTLLVAEVVGMYAYRQFTSGKWVTPIAYLTKKLDTGEWPGKDQILRIQVFGAQWTSFAWDSVPMPVKTAGTLYVDTVVHVYSEIGSAIKRPLTQIVDGFTGG